MCVDFLLKMGVEKDGKDNDGCTALMTASIEGHFECAYLLLKAGANQNAQSNYGYTAFSLATRGGHQACIQLLQQANNASANAAMSSLMSDLEDEKADKTKKNKIKKHKNKKKASSSLADQGHGLGDGLRGEVVVTHIHTHHTHKHTHTQSEFVCCRQPKWIAEPFNLANKDAVRDETGKTALITASFEGHFGVLTSCSKWGLRRKLMTIVDARP